MTNKNGIIDRLVEVIKAELKLYNELNPEYPLSYDDIIEYVKCTIKK